MMPPHVDELRKAIESKHGGKATFAQSVPVSETFEGEKVWEGSVHVFDLSGNKKAKIAYAWSATTDVSTTHRYYAVLGIDSDELLDPIQNQAHITRLILEQ